MSFCWYNNREHITRNWKMNEYVESSNVGFSLELTFFKCLSNRFAFLNGFYNVFAFSNEFCSYNRFCLSDVFGFYSGFGSSDRFCLSDGFAFSSVSYDQYDISSVCLRQLGRELRKVVLPTPIEPRT